MQTGELAESTSSPSGHRVSHFQLQGGQTGKEPDIIAVWWDWGQGVNQAVEDQGIMTDKMTHTSKVIQVMKSHGLSVWFPYRKVSSKLRASEALRPLLFPLSIFHNFVLFWSKYIPRLAARSGATRHCENNKIITSEIGKETYSSEEMDFIQWGSPEWSLWLLFVIRLITFPVGNFQNDKWKSFY